MSFMCIWYGKPLIIFDEYKTIYTYIEIAFFLVLYLGKTQLFYNYDLRIKESDRFEDESPPRSKLAESKQIYDY